MDEAQEARLKRGRDRLLRELRIIQADAGLSDIEIVALVGSAAGAAIAGIDPRVTTLGSKPDQHIDLD